MSSSPGLSNSDTNSSRASTPPAHATIINEGSLTLTEFVQRLETPGHHTVKYQMSSSSDPNSDTSSSRASSEPTPTTIINEGSLSLAELVQRLETPGHLTVKNLLYWRHTRGLRMPVTPPQVDRFAGRGHELVEDLAYELAGLKRLSVHGILEFAFNQSVVPFGDQFNQSVVLFGDQSNVPFGDQSNVPFGPLNPTRCAFHRIRHAGFTSPFTVLLHGVASAEECQSACMAFLQALSLGQTRQTTTICRAWTHHANSSRCFLSHLALRSLGRSVLEQMEPELSSGEVDECMDFKLDCHAHSLTLSGFSPLKLFRGHVQPKRAAAATNCAPLRIDSAVHEFRVHLPFTRCAFEKSSGEQGQHGADHRKGQNRTGTAAALARIRPI
uniref:Apple domain-containing protein n=1 Tax=Globodera pallida TaxID=36090 RepID=A0A183BUJ7_GLOPA